jgi:histidinol phosphatase-like enzyme
MSALSHIRAVGLDLDGTLTEVFKSTPLPDVADALDVLRARNFTLRVLTNQAGLVYRDVTSKEFYPTAEKLALQLDQAATNLGLRDIPWYISVYDPALVSIIMRQYERAAADANNPELAMSNNPEEEAREELAQYARKAASRLQMFLNAYGLSHWRVGADPTWRKPLPGMLGAMSAEIGMPLSAIAYVGDMDGTREIPARSGRYPDSDKRFAEAAGCFFAGSLEALLQTIEKDDLS